MNGVTASGQDVSDPVALQFTLVIQAPRTPDSSRFGVLDHPALPANGWPQTMQPTPEELASLAARPLGHPDTPILRVQGGEKVEPPPGPGALQPPEELRALAKGRPVPPALRARPFMPEQVQGLRSLIGQSSEGASALLERLDLESSIPLPPGASRASLEQYAKAAQAAVAAGKDRLGVQALRLAAIRRMLEHLP